MFGHYTTINYRESYGMHASTVILYNHESPRRPETFVTRKITKAAARIANGSTEPLQLGNMSARRDWGFAGDYVKAMVAALRHDEPDDFVVATGISHSIEDFGGDASKAKRVLGWEAQVDLQGSARMMVEEDLVDVRRGSAS